MKRKVNFDGLIELTPRKELDRSHYKSRKSEGVSFDFALSEDDLSTEKKVEVKETATLDTENFNLEELSFYCAALYGGPLF